MHRADDLDTFGDEFRGFSDVAILYRTQHEGKKLAELLNKKGYPYQISSGEGFWERKEVRDFVEELEGLREGLMFEGEKFSDFLAALIENFVESQKLREGHANRLRHLVSYALAFDGMDLDDAFSAFLDEVKLEQEADNLIFGDRINLLTLHASKGLEFPIVLIFGMEEGVIPSLRAEDDSEERRLFYVGMTRAKEDLHLFYTKKRGDSIMDRSRFLKEIGTDNLFLQVLSEKRAEKLKKKEIKRAQMSLF